MLLLSLLPAPPARAGGFSNPDFGIRRLGMLAVVDGRPHDERPGAGRPRRALQQL